MYATHIIIGLYLLFMLVTGIYFYSKSLGVEDYLLGGRGVGSWVTAFSAQTSDMSGWLFLAFPGAVYLAGLDQIHLAVGLLAGTFLNWHFVAPRLRVYTEITNSLTLASFFSDRFRDRTGLLRVFSAIVVLLFFTVYAAAGLASAGKIFHFLFDSGHNMGFEIPYRAAVLTGALIILAYTSLGGYLAVCWTGLLQGLLMLFALVVVPIAAYSSLTPEQMNMFGEHPEFFNLLPKGKTLFLSVVAIISSLAWGLGYFGQPHILVRFMSIKSRLQIPKAKWIAMAWVTICLAGALFVGILAFARYHKLANGQEEEVFIYMAQYMFSPWMAGILFSGILAAIMSTIDSQLLVAASALTADFYRHFLNKGASEKEQLKIGRFFVLLITLVALVLALADNKTIFELVGFAWGGFGAAFGPVVIMALFSRKTSARAAACGMATGTVVMVLWCASGLNACLYELLPGFACNLLVIFIVSRFRPEQNNRVLQDYDKMKRLMRNPR